MMGLSCFKSWKQDRTRHKGNRDVLASPGSYFFLSNSAGQGDEWLKTLNRGAWIPFTGVFGQRLEETVLYERKFGARLVPLVVEQCVDFIRDRGLREVGLFRRPGQTRTVQELRRAYDCGERPTFDSSTDVHTVASLLKLYIRQLPEPLVPYSHYQHFLRCGRSLSTDRAKGLLELRLVLLELPVANFNLLNFICQFLNEVQSFSSSNKMCYQNLAVVFGPNILRSKTDDAQSIVGGAALVQVLMLELIRESHSLFSKVPPPSLRASHGAPCAPPCVAPCLRQLSLPLIMERDPDPAGQSCISKSEFFQKKLLGHRHTSSHPETSLFQPQRSPSPSHDPPQHQGALYEPSLSWTEAWPNFRDPNVDYWTPEDTPNEGLASLSGASSLSPGVCSSPSAYDNIQRQSSSHSDTFENVPEKCIGDDVPLDEQKERSSPSWSSCEIIPLEETLSPAHSVKSEMELVLGQSLEKEDAFESLHFTTPTSRSEPSASPLSTGSSEVFLPPGHPGPQGSSEPPEPHNQDGEAAKSQLADVRPLLAELQRQMDQQRVEYQARILRLERCNHVLERQIAALRLTLELQRRSHSVAESRIKDEERAQADAQRRNDKLQRDMDLFLQTSRPRPDDEDEGNRGRTRPRPDDEEERNRGRTRPRPDDEDEGNRGRTRPRPDDGYEGSRAWRLFQSL